MTDAVLPIPRARVARAAHVFGASVVEPSRRALQVALGLAWLLDAALQYQPYMFGHGLANDIVAPTGSGSPVWVATPVHWTAQLIGHAPVALNALFATVQLVIAVGLLTRRTVRPALVASAVWALGLWWLAEGLGGVLAGPVPPAAGLPGAAVLYAVIAVLLWPAPQGAAGRSVAERSPARAGGTRLVWVVLWAGFAFEALRPANRSPTGLHDLIAGNEGGEPGWVKDILRWGASGAAHHGTEIAIATAIAFALIAVFGTAPRGRRPALVLAIVLSALIWVFGEAFGQIATGHGTDPNSGPLLALLALTLWPTRQRESDQPQERERSHPSPLDNIETAQNRQGG